MPDEDDRIIRSDLSVSTKSRKDMYCLFTPEVDLTGAVPGGRQTTVMQAGESYLYQTAYATKFYLEMKMRGAPSGDITLFSEYEGKLPEWYSGQDLTDKSILLIRQGGIGDLIMLTPLINGLKSRYKDCRVIFATAVEYGTILTGIVDKTVSLPLAKSVFETYDYFLHFTETIEKSPADPTKPASDMFIEIAGHDPKDFPKKFSCNIDAMGYLRACITKWTAIKYEPENDILVGVQPRSNNIIRNIPPENIRSMLVTLGAGYRGYKFVPVLLDREKKIRYADYSDVPYLVDLREKTTLKDYIALLSMCDLIIAPDSSAVHVGAAFDIPTVALYGPFTPESRTSYYPDCTVIRGGFNPVPIADKPNSGINGCSGCMNQEGCVNTDVRGYSYCMLDMDREEIGLAVLSAADKVIEGKAK